MDICHLTINPIDYERRIKNQAESLLKIGHSVHIVALGNSGENKNIEWNGATIIRIKTPFFRGGPLKFLHFNIKVFSFLLFKNFKIIHCHDLWTIPAGLLLRLLKNFKLVYDAHEYYAGLEVFTRNKLKRKIWMLVETLAIQYIDVLITVSDPIAQLYRERYSSLKSIVVIRNVPKLETIVDNYKQHLPETDKKIIIFHGHFRPGRGLLQLVEAMTLINDGHLVLIGGGELQEEIEKKIKILNVQHKISLKNYISTDELIATTSAADLGVVLYEHTSVNYKHALPNKFFEYIMAGIPILASNLGTFEEYINSYDIGKTVDPQNIPEIAKVIDQMLSNEEQLLKWRANSIRASKDLNWEIESEKLYSVYEKIQN